MAISFIKSAVLPQDFPIHRKKEVAFMGRSNAGKSSLINSLAKKTIAKVSQNPGKTRLLNFFDFPSYVLVDMPGYGYAARGSDEISDWQPMIETYLAERESLAGLVLVMDIRRRWTNDEAALTRFAQHYGRPVALALTKSDKLKKAEINKAFEKQKKDSKLNDVFIISNTGKIGHEELEEFIFRRWVQEGNDEYKP